MKRALALLLIVLLLGGLTACQKSDYNLLDIPELEHTHTWDFDGTLPDWVEDADWKHEFWAYTLPDAERADYDRTAQEFFSDMDLPEAEHPENIYLGHGTCLESLDSTQEEVVFRMAYPVVYNGVIISWIITYFWDEFRGQGSTNYIDEMNFILENDLATKATPFRPGYNHGHTIFVVGHTVYDIFQVPNADEKIDFNAIPDPDPKFKLVNIMEPLE